jgi:hypothetical protein
MAETGDKVQNDQEPAASKIEMTCNEASSTLEQPSAKRLKMDSELEPRVDEQPEIAPQDAGRPTPYENGDKNSEASTELVDRRVNGLAPIKKE